MKRAGLLLPFLTLILNAQKVTAQEKRTSTPEDMVNIRMVYDANASPDGKSVAFVISEPADPNKPATHVTKTFGSFRRTGASLPTCLRLLPRAKSFRAGHPMDAGWPSFPTVGKTVRHRSG